MSAVCLDLIAAKQVKQAFIYFSMDGKLRVLFTRQLDYIVNR